MTCPHDRTERVNAMVDGLCPVCMEAELERLRAALKQIVELSDDAHTRYYASNALQAAPQQRESKK